MSVNQFMSEKIPDIKTIIGKMQKPFDYHAFIRCFAKEFQADYVMLLSQYSNDPFGKVHQQIGRFLYDNQKKLGIKSNGRVISENIFGLPTDNEEYI